MSGIDRKRNTQGKRKGQCEIAFYNLKKKSK